MLDKLGFEVETSLDGYEAIKKYEEAIKQNLPFDYVIMDLTIPGSLGGKDTIRELSKINPDIKAIVSSGFSKDPILGNYKKYNFKGILAKPYTIDQLRELFQSLEMT